MPEAPDEPVGSLAEETAKLLGTLAEWVRHHADAWEADLEACPLWQEVRSAVADLGQAVNDLLDPAEADGRARSSAGFQTIDLDDPEGT
ncbi:hypothetical protein [Tenggerimyces flavus]|uniref:Uncharacterized protein n=1 Tax=Tenggerimyces flavus TaxID=1708749 RepID=A0ABV7Y578_9ACTN|nr:hypothetical protein [Tenggerimyces flavus]MBM7788688.1 hypothetical protein [Tenggerimyces flavus]